MPARASGPTSSVDALVRRAAVLAPLAEAVVDGDRRVTWRDLADRVSRLAGALCGMGLRRGQTLGIICDNSLEVLEMHFAAPSAGLALLPLNTRLAGAELAECLDDAKCRVVIAGPAYVERLRAAAPTVRVIATGNPAPGALHYDDLLSASRMDPVGLRSEDVAYLYYTSGTTGRPKGVELSSASVMAGALGCAAACGIGAGARWLHAGPMFHLADAWAIWAVTWLGGCHVTARFSAERTLHTLRAERIEWTALVPTALDRLASAARANGLDISGTRGLLYGGAPLMATTWDAAVEHLRAPLVGTYGATETSGTVTVLPWADQIPPAAGGIGRVGREIPGTAVTLVDQDGEPAAPGVVGELVVDSPTVMLGYRDRPEETGSALTDGRYRTGDLGCREADGVIRVVGRSKDMIISGGENVYPAEVENVLSLHPAISAVAVIGLPNAEWGESLAAVVVVDGEAGSAPDLVGVREFGLSRLAAYKLPRELHVVDALPLTGSGKVDKNVLRIRYTP